MATGKLAVTGVVFTDQRDFYPNPGDVARINPSTTPFISKLFSMPTVSVPDADYKMFQKDPTWRTQEFSINNVAGEAWAVDGTPGDTNAVVVDGPVGIVIDSSLLGAEVEIWDSTKATYRGNALVTTVTSSTAITLTSIGNPASATEAVANLVDDDVLIVVGTAHGETSSSPDAYSGSPTVVFNSLEHQRTSLELSFDLIKAAMRGVEGQSRLSEERTDKLDEHKMRFERKLLSGYRPGGIGGVAHSAGGGTDSTFIGHIQDASSDDVRKTMGLLSVLRRYGRTSGTEQNVFAPALDAYQYKDFVADMDKATQFDNTGVVREIYCGPTFYNFWSELNTAVGAFKGWTVNVEQREDQIGRHTRRIVTPDVTVDLIKMNDWRGRYAFYGLMPDFRYLRLASYPGMAPVAYFSDIKKDNRPLVQKDEYHSQLGLMITNVKAHTLFKATAT